MVDFISFLKLFYNFYLFFQAQLGIYDASIEEPMFPELINSGLYFILRVSLDKNVEMIISSSLVAIQNILKIISDEVRLT